MTRDEIQKLIGGYATGSLTESERKLLFDAALEDQELFDQLAQEQALKELLEEPGVKQRLVAALEPHKPKRALWSWVAASAAVGLAVLIGVVMLRTPEKPRETAAITKSVEPPAAPVAPPVTTPQYALKSEPAAPAKSIAPRKAEPKAVKAFVPENVPTLQEPPSPPAPLPEAPKVEISTLPVQPQIVPPVGVINGFRADAPTAAAPAPAAVGGGRGGGGKGAGRAPVSAALSLANIRFAFDYSFDTSGALRILLTSQGYLSVSQAAQPNTKVQPPAKVLFPSQVVQPSAPVIVQIPTDATELIVSFSASPGITGSPVRLEETSGTVSDQSPPNRRILVTIPVKR